VNILLKILQGEIEILMEDPSFFSNLCIFFMSIALAVLLERASKEKTKHVNFFSGFTKLGCSAISETGNSRVGD